jgi:uncharacterized protein (DUF488 family)
MTGKLITFGYEGQRLADLWLCRDEYDVHIVVDVRLNATSRWAGFSKKYLVWLCTGIDIQYRHEPALGVPSARRRRLRTEADYADLWAWYRGHLTEPEPSAAIDRIVADLRAGRNVCLLCREADPQRCHRHLVAEEVERRLGGTR